MKHLVFSVMMVVAAAAMAQPKEAAKPEAPKPEAARATAVKDAAAPKKMPNPRRWNEDARHCLERGNNTDIIKCAEEFL